MSKTIFITARLGFGTMPTIVSVITTTEGLVNPRAAPRTYDVGESWSTTSYRVQVEHIAKLQNYGDFAALEEEVMRIGWRARSYHEVPYRAVVFQYDVTNDPSFRSRKSMYMPRYFKVVSGDGRPRRDRDVEVHYRLTLLSKMKEILNPRGPSFIEVLDFELADEVEKALIEAVAKPPPREPQDFAAVSERTSDDIVLAIALPLSTGPKYRVRSSASTPTVIGSGS